MFEDFATGVAIGIVAGGVLSYLYAAFVINEYKRVASEVGVLFQKVEGKLTAIKKVL